MGTYSNEPLCCGKCSNNVMFIIYFEFMFLNLYDTFIFNMPFFIGVNKKMIPEN